MITKSMQSKYKIIIVDDQPIFREGLKLYLENELGHLVISEAKNGKEFIKLSNLHQSDIILMDIEMPEMNGLDASKKILKRYPYLNIIAITMYQDKAYLKDLIERGIKGFIHKSSTFDEIGEIMDMVYNNGLCFPENLKLFED